MFVSRNDIHESEVHKFVAEASDIGLSPGQWPEYIHTDAGNKMPFGYPHFRANEEGELECVIYRQLNGCISLIIFND